MANYYLNEAVFDLPERPFTDKTIHGLEAKLPGGTLGVLVHRRATGGKPLRALVDESLAVNEKRLSAFAVLADEPATVGGLPAVLLRTRWRAGAATLLQHQAHVVVGDTLMIFAVSAPESEAASCDETFGSMLETMSFRTE